MPRKDRFETVCDDSTHHVTQRGINRSRIFRCDEDYISFKEFLARYLSRFKIKIYNYCLMPNHIHILLFTEEALHLSRFMHGVLLSYGAYYRKKYKYTGYLWQGRFKSSPIEKESYLLECARYIERNPLRAKSMMVDDLSAFRWSSYNFYADGKTDDIVTVNPLYAAMGKTTEERQSNYKAYILTPRPYEELLDDVFNK